MSKKQEQKRQQQRLNSRNAHRKLKYAKMVSDGELGRKEEMKARGSIKYKGTAPPSQQPGSQIERVVESVVVRETPSSYFNPGFLYGTKYDQRSTRYGDSGGGFF